MAIGDVIRANAATVNLSPEQTQQRRKTDNAKAISEPSSLFKSSKADAQKYNSLEEQVAVWLKEGNINQEEVVDEFKQEFASFYEELSDEEKLEFKQENMSEMLAVLEDTGIDSAIKIEQLQGSEFAEILDIVKQRSPGEEKRLLECKINDTLVKAYEAELTSKAESEVYTEILKQLLSTLVQNFQSYVSV